jgi:hypothetical protein
MTTFILSVIKELTTRKKAKKRLPKFVWWLGAGRPSER